MVVEVDDQVLVRGLLDRRLAEKWYELGYWDAARQKRRSFAGRWQKREEVKN